jgi:hypothetical protein
VHEYARRTRKWRVQYNAALASLQRCKKDLVAFVKVEMKFLDGKSVQSRIRTLAPASQLPRRFHPLLVPMASAINRQHLNNLAPREQGMAILPQEAVAPCLRSTLSCAKPHGLGL